MQPIIDQISSLLAAGPNNYLFNNGLRNGSQSALDFKQLLGALNVQPVSANFAALPGTVLPSDPGINDQSPVQILQNLPDRSHPLPHYNHELVINIPDKNISVTLRQQIGDVVSKEARLHEINARESEITEFHHTLKDSSSAQVSEPVLPSVQQLELTNNLAQSTKDVIEQHKSDIQTKIAEQPDAIVNREPLKAVNQISSAFATQEKSINSLSENNHGRTKTEQQPGREFNTENVGLTREKNIRHVETVSTKISSESKSDPSSAGTQSDRITTGSAPTSNKLPLTQAGIETFFEPKNNVLAENTIGREKVYQSTNDRINTERIAEVVSQDRPEAKNRANEYNIDINRTRVLPGLSQTTYVNSFAENKQATEKAPAIVNVNGKVERLQQSEIPVNNFQRQYTAPQVAMSREFIPVSSEAMQASQQITGAESGDPDLTPEQIFSQKVAPSVSFSAEGSTLLKNNITEILPATTRHAVTSDGTVVLNKSNEISNSAAVAEQIVWAQRNNANQIRISVSPEHLGNVDINIDDAGDGLNIQFVTQSLLAREALENFIPRLREMLDQSGLNLQNVNVSQNGEGKNNFAFSENQKGQSEDTSQNKLREFASDSTDDSDAQENSNYLLDAFA